ncbi:MAG: DNA-3-methyladenine glycosylase I [Nostocoides sp.]
MSLLLGADGLLRCSWAGTTPDYLDYHDLEWGRPAHGEAALFERITLEAFQSGLSWLTILRKRPAFRVAFADFDPDTVAGFGPEGRDRLLSDASIVRNRARIDAAIHNAGAVVELRRAGGLDELVHAHTPARHHRPGPDDPIPDRTAESVALAKDLKAHGFVFVGPVTAYATMQACGLVDDHRRGCFRSGE